MPSQDPTTIRLEDYTAPAFLVDTIELDIAIHDDHARVSASQALRRNPSGATPHAPLVLHGEDLTLESIRIDGHALAAEEFTSDEAGLTITRIVPDAFLLQTVCRIAPDSNTQLSGLYRSKDGYFTQCEAEGFRRITYAFDRPDVMSRYVTTIHANKARFPVLLSNGNPVASGDEADGRHFATWEDPFPKPAYLFAMVAATLDVLEDSFTTMSGRVVRCAVYVEPGKLDRCAHAMAALKLSMDWDERVFGREMDLDHYMIVAVSDFNMGAMENKGLNIFNTKFVLARPDTATDVDYENIDRVVAHEYFHNWSGNRVTCRDWFQLSLKEGLTVYRDQEFGADVHSRAVTRIREVRTLRTAQFPEDAGPMAHPIQPASYQEINNFYTPTVYEKGAEVVRMIATLVGRDTFRRAMDLYFARFDGMAVTCDDFVATMAEASGRDFSQFKRWYVQAGTPTLNISGTHDAASRRFTLDVRQSYPETAYERRARTEGRTVVRGPYHLPLALGLLDSSGAELPLRLEGERDGRATSRVLEVVSESQRFVFEDVTEPPTPSLLRGFSAPVVLDYSYSEHELAHLMANDTDAFVRWESGQRLAMLVLERGVAAFAARTIDDLDWIPSSFIDAVRDLLETAFVPGGDAAFVAEALSLPSELVMAEAAAGVVDPDAIHAARNALRRATARALESDLASAYERLAGTDAYAPTSNQIGARALRNTCLSYLAELETAAWRGACVRQFEQATCMTDTIAALGIIAQFPGAARDHALATFLGTWQHEALVVDKWLFVQSTSRASDTPARVRALLDHPAFDIKNPNKVYALVRAFCGANPKHFHAKDGAGYALGADVILALDSQNPQVASRIARCFDRWLRFDEGRRAHARRALRGIAAKPDLSKDVAEVVSKALEGDEATV